MAMIPNQLPRLASDPTGHSLGLDLPPGSLTGPADSPYLWSGHAPAGPDTWAALRPAARTAGLLPVLLGGDRHPDDWRLTPELTTDPADHDADEVLADLWHAYAAASAIPKAAPHPKATATATATAEEPPGSLPSHAETVSPFTDAWPGTSPALPLHTDPDHTAAAVAVAATLTEPGSWLADARPALVPARRSADIPATIGWTGPLDHETDTARLSAVLRSWEDRFGARLIALTPNQLLLSIAAPPLTTPQAQAIAPEHLAFSPTTLTQSPHPTLHTYAHHTLLNAPIWTFRWS
ncbi:DUF4253 domain-containing protein [Streptomyces sp. NPDC056361]|uniref:DUF4253 domain-containing protein n=1 Tax=Streptomyces sp. NPDC056361 TaxID=3345795 RepID=UPI0035E0C17D